MPSKIRILFLSANPEGTTKLQVIQEYKLIDSKIQASEYRDQFDLEQSHAVSLMELQTLLLRFKPNIVHFSGHGSKTGALIFENLEGLPEEAPPKALSVLFRIINEGASSEESQDSRINCVVLSACYSIKQAKAIAQHVDCVIGISEAIKDTSATNFAASFYQALGFGKSVQTAFEFGRNQLELSDDADESILKLEYKSDVLPGKIFLTSQNTEQDAAGATNQIEKRKKKLLEHCSKIIDESEVEHFFRDLVDAKISEDYSGTELGERGVYRYVKHLLEHLYTGQRGLYDLIAEYQYLQEMRIPLQDEVHDKIRKKLEVLLDKLGFRTYELGLVSRLQPQPKLPTVCNFKRLSGVIIGLVEVWPSKKFSLEHRYDEWFLKVADGAELTILNLPNEGLGRKLADALNDLVREQLNELEPFLDISRRFTNSSHRFESGFTNFFSNLKVGSTTLDGACRYCLNTDFHSDEEVTRYRGELAKLWKN